MLKQAKNRSVTYIKGATQVVSRVVVNRYIGRYLAFFISVYPIFQKTFILMARGTFIVTALRTSAHKRTRLPFSIFISLPSLFNSSESYIITQYHTKQYYSISLLLVTEKQTL